MKIDWRFPILDGGKRQGINDSGIATFAGEELYNNLAREICQNSLDAKDTTVDEPVKVSFSLKTLGRDAFAPIKGLEKILQSCQLYWKTFNDQKLNYFLNDAFATLSNDPIDLLVISDFNTIGLNGSKNRTGAWDALTGSNGVSYKTNGSQGSFGIGKNAPYACSNLRTVFYNTYSKIDNLHAFQGVTMLVTHMNEDNEETQGCGFYYNVDDKKPIFEEDNCITTQYFRRDEYGTDIIILGFKKNSNWKNDIKLAIIKNFFIAIINKQLIVEIDDIRIDSTSIFKYIKEALQLYPKDNEIVKVNNYCTTYTQPDKIFKCSILEKNDVQLYIRTEDNYTRSTACLRSTGMLIKHRTIKKMKPYEAVLLVTGGKMNEILKLMEPPKHDKWDPDILSDERKKEGKNISKKLNKFIADSIESVCKMESFEEIDPDGISSFLPDDVDFVNQKGKIKNNTKLNPVSEIVSLKKKKPEIPKETIIGTTTTGQIIDEDDIHNNSDSGKLWDSEIPKIGIEGEGENKIVTPNPDGNKIFKNINKTQFRVLPIKPENGIYKLVFVSEKNYSCVQFSFQCIGEDGSHENINVLGVQDDNEYKKLNTSYYEVYDVKKGKILNTILKLDVKDRVLLSVGGAGNEIIG